MKRLKYEVDPLHQDLVDGCLGGLTEEVVVTMTGGELYMFHTLLQDYGPGLVGDQHVRLMERSLRRLVEASRL